MQTPDKRYIIDIAIVRGSVLMPGYKTSQRVLMAAMRPADEGLLPIVVVDEHGRTRAEQVAASAKLTPAQEAFRASRRFNILRDALPLSVWRANGFWPSHGQKNRPIAKCGRELWYHADQVG